MTIITEQRRAGSINQELLPYLLLTGICPIQLSPMETCFTRSAAAVRREVSTISITASFPSASDAL